MSALAIGIVLGLLLFCCVFVACMAVAEKVEPLIVVGFVSAILTLALIINEAMRDCSDEVVPEPEPVRVVSTWDGII